jgi:pimeloyl-ACP methyl ester carboxylesterase
MSPAHLPRPRTLAAVALTGAAALLLSACSSAPAIPKQRDLSTDVPFTACSAETCSGSLDGAAYKIEMPEKWNGTLLIYSHGYRYAQPAPPEFSPVETSAVDSPDDQTAQTLLSQGFALAGSAYKSNGWAVSDGVAAAEGLYAHFSEKVATPNRTLVWGDSLGGLITQVIAEKHPEWVDGAAPLCGAVAGVVPNMNLALDISYAVKTLIYPEMKITGYSSYQEAVDNWTQAMKRLIAAASDTAGGGTAKVLYIADLVDAPIQTKTYDGSTIQSKVKATVEALATGLGYATFARYDLEQRFSGNPSGNQDTDYSKRISESEASLINAVTPGAVEANDALMAAGQRVSADPAALAKALADGGDPKGTITRPEITLHTAADPLVIAQNETFLLDRYSAEVTKGNATAGLVQLYTVAPATYPESTGAPYGAGHCNFTSQSNVAVVDLLNDWVQKGIYPGEAAIEKAMGTESGYVGAWRPGQWPGTNA